MKPLFILVGPTCSGKTTLANSLGLRVARSTTSRPRRVGEPEDAYHFVDVKAFHRKELVGKTEYSGNWYGLDVAELNDADVVILEPRGAVEIKNYYAGTRPVYIIGIAVNPEIARERMIRRGDKSRDIARRVFVDGHRFAHLSSIADYYAADGDISAVHGYIEAKLSREER